MNRNFGRIFFDLTVSVVITESCDMSVAVLPSKTNWLIDAPSHRYQVVDKPADLSNFSVEILGLLTEGDLWDHIKKTKIMPSPSQVDTCDLCGNEAEIARTLSVLIDAERRVIARICGKHCTSDDPEDVPSAYILKGNIEERM